MYIYIIYIYVHVYVYVYVYVHICVNALHGKVQYKLTNINVNTFGLLDLGTSMFLGPTF